MEKVTGHGSKGQNVTKRKKLHNVRPALALGGRERAVQRKENQHDHRAATASSSSRDPWLHDHMISSADR
eukprot:scaffold38160_cov283-Skeletonema_dohrnii-CCMP3373.AAC.1